MRVAIDDGNGTLIEGEIEMGPASNGCIRLKMDSGKTHIGHVDSVLPLDEEAEDRMKNGYSSMKVNPHGKKEGQ